MKILAIRGEAIASLAGAFDVDLEGGPIGQAGIFAITGPTGSGKSSLLDAMCLALFDRTPRLKKGGSVAVGHAGIDEALRVKEHDPRGLLSRGAGKGFAQVDFVGVDKQRYRATWSVARARKRANGRLQDQKLQLVALPSKVDLSGATKTETLKQIEARLGLEYDQFRRSVLLAQGEFAEFLKAKGSERAALLERMTGTEIYAKISKAAFSKAKTEGKALGELRTKLETLTVLEPEARAALDESIATAEALASSQAAEFKRIELGRAWYAEAKTRRTDLDEVHERLGEHFDSWASFEADAWTAPALAADDAGTTLASFVTTQRAKLEQARAADASVTSAQTEHTRLSGEMTAAKADLDASSASIAEAKAKKAALAEQLAAHEAWLAQHATSGALAEDWALVEQKLRDLDKNLGELEQVAASREAFNVELPALRTKLEELAAAHKANGAELDAAKKRAATLAEQVEAHGDDELRAQREQFVEREGHLKGLGDALRTHWALRSAQTQDLEQLKADKAELATHTAELPLAADRVEQADTTLRLTRETLGLEERRHELLHEDAPCPLCGSPEHPYAHAAPQAGALVAKLEAELKDKRQAHAKLVADKAKLDERIALRESKLSEAKAQLAESAGALTGHLEAWGAPLADFDGSDWPGAKVDAQVKVEAQLAQSAEALSSQKAAIDTTLAEHKKVTQSAKLAQTEQAKLQETLDAAAKKLQAAKDQLAKQEQVAEGLATREQHAQVGANEALAVLGEHGFAPDWQVDLRADVEVFVQGQQERVTQWRERQRQQSEATHAIPVVVAELKAHEQSKATASKLLTKLDKQLVEAQRVLATHTTQRAQLFCGEPSAEVAALLGEIDTAVTLRAERATRLAAHEQQGAPETPLLQLDERREALLAEQEALKVKLEADRGTRSVDDNHHAERMKLGANIEAQQAELARWDKLSGLIGKADGAKFRDYAQGLTLKIVLEYANAQLQELRPRYRLMAVPGHNLEIQVVDQEMGDEVRPVSSLSGGETFLASLALALGLAESTNSATAVESLFIDEGFGTLDGDTLELAIATLDALQDRGRSIGIISHVEGLAGRLGAQVRMVPQGGGRSRVEVVGGAG